MKGVNLSQGVAIIKESHCFQEILYDWNNSHVVSFILIIQVIYSIYCSSVSSSLAGVMSNTLFVSFVKQPFALTQESSK